MSDDDVFKVQTVPPPPGEADAYSAPTKVGAMAASIVEEVILHAKRQADSAAMKAARLQPNAHDHIKATAKVQAFQLPSVRPPVSTPIITTLETGDEAPEPKAEEPKPEEPVLTSEALLEQIDRASQEALASDARASVSPPLEPSLEPSLSGATDAGEEAKEEPGDGASEAPVASPRAELSRNRQYVVPVLLFALALVCFALYLVRRH